MAVSRTRVEPSVHQLRLLLVLAEELHYGRAAARLFITQPALSRQIRALEERLGVVLVERTSRKVELTPSGAALLPRVRAVVEAVDGLQEAADAHGRSVSGRLVVGTFEAMGGLPLVQAILRDLQYRHPTLTVEVRGVDFVTQTSALYDESVDAVICILPLPAGIQAQPLGQEPQVICVPSSDPLAARESVRMADLAGRELIGLTEEVAQVWRDAWLTRHPDGPDVRYTIHQACDLETVLSAVALGQGLALAPAGCRQFFPRPGIRYVTVTDADPCVIGVAWLARRRDNPAVAALRDVARSVAAAR
ncbi:LysR family transcriptional regulator [Allostreptomyces psammosilenae]|uniref:DNA-binding transcriptional LysR family regulator n=1 Tax=Allostreptomyces psammosilenae TaxID=1892865 RepID=A0A853A139_9ACTN|nr:LysR family transcriptional regulator [Allostreptomyces psammosilenae]NYI07170.1 DNA-binding transcriptional LysR family regulator [Allostreptomyces psammosilenae]